MIDDMERILSAAKCVQERGAYRIYVIATHGIFCDTACELLSQSPITEVRRQLGHVYALLVDHSQ